LPVPNEVLPGQAAGRRCARYRRGSHLPVPHITLASLSQGPGRRHLVFGQSSSTQHHE